MCLPRERAQADSTEVINRAEHGENQVEDPIWATYLALERRFEEMDIESKDSKLCEDHTKMIHVS